MKTLIVTIETENDAFVHDSLHQVERILLSVIRAIGQGHTERRLLDANGNTVGRFSYGP